MQISIKPGECFQHSLTWPTGVPLFALYISFLLYLSGPVGLYMGHGFLIALYYYRIAVIFLFALIWMIISERKTFIDAVLIVLWFLTMLTYFVGWYVHRRTYKFFRSRWIGYDDGDLVLAAKLQARGLPLAAYDMGNILLQ